MTPHHTRPSQNAALAFVVSVIATGVWVGLMATVPLIYRSALFAILPPILVNLLLLAGAWEGLMWTSLNESKRAWTWIAIAVLLMVWLGGTWGMIISGLARQGISRIPIVPLLIFVPTALVIVGLWRSRRIGMLLDAIPTTWLIGVQFYRVVGAVFLLAWAQDTSPTVFAWPAGVGDVITGLMALSAAARLAAGAPGSTRTAIVWNFFGMADLILAIVLGTLSAPGALQHLPVDHPNLIIEGSPFAIIPILVVPVSFILHLLSLRQLLRGERLVAPVMA